METEPIRLTLYAHLCRLEVDKDVVVIMNGMGESIRAAAPPLEILATNQAPIGVDV